MTRVDRIGAALNRVHPLLELLVVEVSYILVAWVMLPCARLFGWKWLEFIGLLFIGVILIWMIFLSHYFRGRSLEELGCETPIKWKIQIKKFSHKGPRNVLLMFGVLLLVFIMFTRELADSTKLLPIIGDLNDLLIPRIGAFGVLVISIIEFELLLTVATRIMLKLDNIKESFSAHFTSTFPLLFILILITMIQFPENLENMTFVKTVAGFFNYIFWAFLQQVPFMGYVNTQLREGLARQNLVKGSFSRKYLAAALTGLIFMIIHFPAWELSLIAGSMSFFLALVYYDKETRNMFMTSAFHAIFGVIVVYFFNINMATTYTALFP
ncbi:MAG: hypothetical protein ACTSU9_13115 [Promethearchaeota archaeon]